MKNAGGEKKERVFFRRRDLLFVAAACVLALVLFLLWPKSPAGNVAVVTIGYGASQRTEVIPLAGGDRLVDLQGDLPVHLQVQNGAIRFVDSVCPDHTCEAYGYLRHEGDWAACLPAGVAVLIAGEGQVPG